MAQINLLQNSVSPGTPAAGKLTIYAKDDQNLYVKDDSGVETNLTTPSSDDGTASLLTAVSGADTITASSALSLSAYATGQTFRFVSAGANTGAVTLNINSLGAKSVTKNGSTALAAGDIQSGAVVDVTYDGTRFQIKNPATVVSNTMATGKLLGRSTAGAGAVEEITVSTGLSLSAGNLTATGGITLATPVASTSGTAIDFTSIPSGTKRITVMLNGVSTNGTSNIIVQIGDSGGIENSGYVGSNTVIVGTTPGSAAIESSGFSISYATAATSIWHGVIVLNLVSASSNLWEAMGIFGRTDTAAISLVCGGKPLSATLDRVRLTMVNGTDAFDAGTVNISYE